MAGPPWAAHAWAANATIPFAKLWAFQAAFNAIPAAQRDRIIFLVEFVHADKSNHTRVHAWVDADGKRTEIPADAYGGLSLPDRPAWAAQGVLVQTDQPSHSLQLGLDILVPPPAGDTIAVRDLLEAVRQANGAMRAGARQLGGYLAMLAAPTAKEVDITLAGCCGGSATLKGSSAPMALRQNREGVIAIPLGSLPSGDGGVVELSQPATKIDLFPD